MENTKVTLNDRGIGEIELFEDDTKAGKMDIAVSHGRLTVYHTEVYPEYEGRGFAKLLLEQLVDYSRQNGLKIIPLCPYVNLQFRHHPETYADVWDKEWHA